MEPIRTLLALLPKVCSLFSAFSVLLLDLGLRCV
jgi:hypothetical protein